ncbi:MAG: polysaccharide deacetylase family protein [Bacteroidales bacterium]|nr:polysaccharide deacetylase family protein [Bacteroidales bacterium]
MEFKTQILCFHRVSDEFSPAYPPIPVKVFEKILSFINRNYVVIPIEEIDKRNTSGKPRLIITFDDAYYDFYENALPLLNKYKFPALQHVITHSAETGESFWTQRLNKMIEACFFEKRELVIPELQISRKLNNAKEVEKTALEVYLLLLDKMDREGILKKIEESIKDHVAHTRMMGWKELNECTKYGISIGSHTHNHATLSKMNDAELKFELEHSRKLILGNVHSSECMSLAFPNGKYNDEVITVATNAGYQYFLSTEHAKFSGKNPPLVLPRYCIYNKEWWKNYLKFTLYRYYI